MTIFALVDCNNFYASCERIFKPHLENKPVVVLSNNDGCIIARSKEAKNLKIPMGAPFFQWEAFCVKNKVQVFSSNYELYGDISRRVMTLLNMHCPDMEIYSIDEAFLQLDGFSHQNLNEYALNLRQFVKSCTSVPVSIGIAPTKTMAKIANYMAKNHSDSGIFNLCNPVLQEKILANFPIDKIWGIASSLARRLNDIHIYTAQQLRDADPKMLRMHFSVVMEKMVYELRGQSCLSLDRVQPRKQIISSRSFSKPVVTLEELEEAISHYAAIAALKLRNQRSVAEALGVFIQTNMFNQTEKQYSHSTGYRFVTPTADTSHIISMAKKCLRTIYKKGYKYHKAGMFLLNLMPNTVNQYDLLAETISTKNNALMKAMDSINELYGRNTVFYCAEGITKRWQIKFNKRSPRYTTRWNELPIVLCREGQRFNILQAER